MPHPPEHHPQDATPGVHGGCRKRARVPGEAYRTFLTQPHAALVLAFLFLYRVGDIMMFAMAKPLLRDIGIDTAHARRAERLQHRRAILRASIVGGAI